MTQMPFGLDLKSLIIGLVLAWWGVPMLLGLLNRPQAQRAS